MSSISSIGNEVNQFLQTLALNSQQSTTAATAGTATTSTAAAGSDSTSTASQLVQGSGRHHHSKGAGALFQQIQQAVTSALQTAQASGSTSDPNQVIENAIAKVFQQNGNTSPDGTQDAGGDTDSPGATDANSTRAAFDQTLQSFGVDAQQFRKDFLAAIQDAQGGQINPSLAFQSFPPGTAIDTTA